MESKSGLDIIRAKILATIEKKNKDTSVEIMPSFNFNDIKIDANIWKGLENVVVVFADLKDSTKLAYEKDEFKDGKFIDASISALKEAFDYFDPIYMQFQGDGGYGIYYGEYAYERAVAAAISVHTYNDHLPSEYHSKTGFKVGVASGKTLIKKSGQRGVPEHQTLIWSGIPINYAAKCVSACESVGDTIITGDVLEHITRNEFLLYSCGHNTDGLESPISPVWKSFTIESISFDKINSKGAKVSGRWCSKVEEHGFDYLDEIKLGVSERKDITETTRESLTILNEN